MLDEKIAQYAQEIEQFTPRSPEDAEAFRLKFLVVKGAIRNLFDAFKSVSSEQKRSLGQSLNELKQAAAEMYKTLHNKFSASRTVRKSNIGELTLPCHEFIEG